MPKLNKDFNGIQIADELHNTGGTGIAPLEHDTFWIGANFEVWTGPGQTGTELSQGADYVFYDKDFTLSMPPPTGSGQDVYTRVEILPPYQSVDLYFTYKTVGDYADAEDHNDQEQRIEQLESDFETLSWKAPVANYSALPIANNAIGDIKMTLDSREIYVWDGASWLKSQFDRIETTYTAGEVLSANQIAAVDSNGKAIIASKDDVSKSNVIGIVKYYADVDDPVKIQVLGIMEGFSGLVIGEKVFLGNTGDILQDEDQIEVGEYRVLLGLAKDDDEVDVNISEAEVVDTSTNVSVRQTVMHGEVDDGGYPNFLQQDNVGSITIKGAATPCVITFANGFDDEDGEINYVYSESSDVEPTEWQNVLDDGSHFLYSEYNPATRQISYGRTKVTPFYEDKFYSYRHHLLHMDGADGSTTIIDEYGNDWNVFNNAQLSTTGSPTEGVKFGPSCLVLDSATNDYIDTDLAGDEDYPFNPSHPFTMECWFYTNDYTQSSQCIFGTENTGFILGFGGPDTLRFYASGDGSGWTIASNATGSTSLVNDQWYKLVFEYDGFVYRIYLDGQLEIEVSSTDRIRRFRHLQVGGRLDGTSWPLNGGIDEVRITFGSLRYGGTTMVPETSAFDVDANYYIIPEAKMFSGGPNIPSEVVRTYLGEVEYDRTTFSLMHFDGDPASTDFEDEYNNRWTASGNARISPGRQPKFGTTYGLLPGGADWFESSNVPTFGTSFTVEFWWYAGNLEDQDQYLLTSWNTYCVHTQFNDSGNPGVLTMWLSSNGSSWDIATAVPGTKTDWIENHWYKITFEYDGTTYRIYVDGVSDITWASPLQLATSGGVRLGRYSTNYLRGGFDEFRFVNDAVVYGGPHTPETSELTMIANTVSLLHFNGSDGDTAITDEAGPAWTVVGSAHLDSGILPKFGDGFIYLDGSGGYAQSTDVSGLGDTFTIECWFFTRNITSTSGQAIFASTSSDPRISVMINHNVIGRIGLWLSSNGSSWNLNDGDTNPVTGITWETDRWYHIAVEFDGEAYYMYLDGVNIFTLNNSTPIYSDFPGLRVGTWRDGSFPLDGGIEELRLTSNFVRYGAPFTPPTSAFTADSSIKEIINYAFNGRYDSPAYYIGGGYDSVFFDHNIGTQNVMVEHYVKKYENMYWMPQYAHVFPGTHYGTATQTIWRNRTFVRQSPTNTRQPYYGDPGVSDGSDSWEGGADGGFVKVRARRNF
jgi:hypothetical protein